jgi:hypothetical protein
MEIKFGALSRVRNSTVGVDVNPNDDASAVLAKSVDKILADDAHAPAPPYVLLYPDGREVQTLPGSSTAFSVEGYKRFKGKPYQQIILFLCPEESFGELRTDNVQQIPAIQEQPPATLLQPVTPEQPPANLLLQATQQQPPQAFRQPTATATRQQPPAILPPTTTHQLVDCKHCWLIVNIVG